MSEEEPNLICLGIIIIILIIIGITAFEYNDESAVNITETVVDKDISHVREMIGDDCQYHIYTNNSEFQLLQVTDYNKLQKGDTVTVMYNGTVTPILYYEGGEISTI